MHFISVSFTFVVFKLLGQLLKYVGENPSDGEVQDLMSEVDPSASGHFKFPDFLSMMLRKMDENSAEDEIREAFKVFDSVSLKGIILRTRLAVERVKP